MPVTNGRRMSNVGSGLHDKCAQAIAKWDQLEDPVDIEDAVHAFIPAEEPMRSEVIETLGKMLNVTLGSFNEDDEMIAALAQGATSRVVMAEAASGRRSQGSVSGARVSMDDTLDMIKLVIVGDSGVGKTCLMLRFVKDEFVSSTRATIGMDFCTRQLAVDILQASETSVVQRLTVQVWDTAGQEQFHSLTATYYRKAGGVMIVYDSQKRATFEGLNKWINQVEEHAEGVVKMIVAAKCGEGAEEVSEAEGRAFAQAHGCSFATTSSKKGDGVLPAFKKIAAEVLAAEEARDEKRVEFLLNIPQSTVAKKKGGCC